MTYYPIDEDLALRAKEVNSHFDYKEGSATKEYRQEVDKAGLVSEVITVAKKDLKAGEVLDGIGGFTTYGSIADKAESDANNYVPFGLVTHGAKMIKDAKKGQLLTMDMVELDTNTLIYKLRKEQDGMTF